MSWDDNVYYHPERYGLRSVAEFELSEPSYSFDTLAVWKGDKGLYLATDSGCSCPSPFENYNGIEDLTGPLTVDQAVEESKSIRKRSYEPKYDKPGFKAFIAKIKEENDTW